ncbi:hypothetical protein SDJN03_00552, partial [Cucurbita argyrosperma subsp. sororia]
MHVIAPPCSHNGQDPRPRFSTPWSSNVREAIKNLPCKRGGDMKGEAMDGATRSRKMEALERWEGGGWRGLVLMLWEKRIS